jgi:deoxyguanosine kinase
MAYIVVEGPIGVGKTSLSRLLAEHLRARLLLEVVEENPFLAPFYEHPEQNAFKVQAFFLLSRYKQLQDARQGALFQAHTVADYLFDKDFIFASLNLSGAEWELYQDLYQQLRPRLSTPDLVVYLRAEPELLLSRIALRGRPFETHIEATYLQRINDAYDAYFSAYDGPLRIIEAARYDFVANEADRARLVGDILQQAEAA